MASTYLTITQVASNFTIHPQGMANFYYDSHADSTSLILHAQAQGHQPMQMLSPSNWVNITCNEHLTNLN
jgi:hypothetical protein